MSDKNPDVTLFWTYFVGSEREFRNYCHDHGVSPTGRYVRHTESVRQIQGLDPATSRVVFLHGWMDLPEWREIYNACIARGLAQPWLRRESS